MRRWTAGVLALLLLCGGCAPATTVTPQTAAFTCDFTAQYNDVAVGGTLVRYGAGTLSLTFDEPATLNGVTATWDGETVTLSLHGITFSTEAVPELALVKQLAAVLDGALRSEGTCEEQEETVVWQGTVDGRDYRLICDGKSGLPLSLSVPALPLTAAFTY